MYQPPDPTPERLARAAWARRALWVGTGDELWVDRLEATPGWAILADQYRRAGATDDGTIRYHLTQNLLVNVVHAATGVSYTMEKIEALWSSAQEWVGAYIPDRPPATIPSGAAPPERDDLSFECVNLLGAARALRDRMERKWQGARLGLLPALNPDHALAAIVSRLYDTLKRDAITTDFGLLANRVLHITAIPYPWGSYELLSDGRLSFRIPDEVMGSSSPDDAPLPTYTPGRDFMEYSRNLLSAVTAFVEGLLAAFEDPALNRLARRGSD
jgi:hypothetical protein